MKKTLTRVCFCLLAFTLMASVALCQTYTKETNGSLTYTMETASSGTCPIGSPSGPQEPITSYSYYGFAYGSVTLNGGAAYIVSPGGAYCPPNGPSGTNPAMLTGTGLSGDFYSCANNSGCSYTMSSTVPGVLYPQFKILSIVYASPGNLSSDGYTNTLTDGTTTSVGSSFAAGDTITYSFTGGFLGLGTTMSWSYGNAVTTGNSTAVTDTISEAAGVANDSNSGASNAINHQNDLLIIWLNPAISLLQVGSTTSATYSMGTQYQTTGDPLPGKPEAVDSLEVYAGVMMANAKGVTTVPAAILNAQSVQVAGQSGLQTLPGLGSICAKHPNYPSSCTLANQCGCVPSDFAGILAADPLLAFTNTESPLNANNANNPNRFVEITGAELLAGPEEKGGNNPVNSFTESDSTQTAETWTQSLAYTVGYSWEVSWVVLGTGPKLSSATQFTWTNTDSVGESNGSAHEEALSLSSDTVGCYEDVSIFEDTVFHTFAFQQPTGNTSCP
jgi:hypothetical protein